MNSYAPPWSASVNALPASVAREKNGGNLPAPAGAAVLPGAGQGLPPQPAPVTHDVTVLTTKKLAQAKVMGVPPEEFGIERGARDIKTCNYCFHEIVTKTEAQLIAEGYDKDQVRMLGTYVGNSEVETLTRDSVQEHSFQPDGGPNTAARFVKLTEHYVRMDYEGNGKPCLYLVQTGGDQGQILKRDGKPVVEPIDVIPFAATTPVPIPHRFFGRSIADLVIQAQKEKTSLKRGALDNLYLHINPRVEVAEQNAGPNTLDDLLVSRPGGVVRTKIAGGLNWQVVPDIAPSVYTMMQYIDAELEARTGLAKQTQGIDANALQNQTATAVAQVFSASQMRMKLIARIMAEGVRDIFSLLHHTIRSHAQEQQTVRLRNKWVPIDPRNWKTRNDMTINVGLGSGGKAQQFAQIMALLNIQKELLVGGKVNLVDDKALYNSVAEVAKIMGHKNPDKFINDPSATGPDGQPLHPPQPPPPDPKLQVEQMKAQAQMQIEQVKSQHDVQAAQIKAQQDAEKAQMDAFHQKLKTESDIQLAREKHELDAKLALVEAALKEKEDHRKAEMHALEIQMKREQHAHALQQGAQSHQATMEKTSLEHNAKLHEVKHKEETKTGVHQTAQAVKELAESLNAPVEIIRDPKTGRAAGVKRGNKTMMVHRGKDGRPEKLQ